MLQSNLESAWTWRGIAEHLSGIKDFSGRNGLATFRYAKPAVDLALADVSFRERFYGGRSTGISTSASIKVGSGPISGSVGTKLNGLEVNGALKGEFGLLDLFKLARQLTEKAQQLGPLKNIIDQMMSRLPDIKISGEVAVYVGMTAANIWYLRLQSGAGASFKLPGAIPGTNIRGASGAMGRSWQIQLQHWQAHWPKALAY